MTYTFILKCALKLVEEIILYYDARSKKHQIRLLHVSNIFFYVVIRESMTNALLKLYTFFLNNQSDALIIPILFCYKTLHVSGIFFAHHQEFSTVRLALVSFMQSFITE